MGKSQTKKKTRGERHNPMRVPDTHLGGGKGEGKADPAKEKEMLPIFTKVSFRDTGSISGGTDRSVHSSSQPSMPTGRGLVLLSAT
jgi:hypothetical protein